MQAPLPDFIARLLWDVDPCQVDLHRDATLVFERVMSRGSWEAMKWLRTRYARAELAAFVRDQGAKRLSPRDLAYWALVCGVDARVGAGGGWPPWAG